MKTLRRSILAAAVATVLAAPFAVYAQDIKPRLIRFGYGLNEQSNQGAPSSSLPSRWRRTRAAR